MGEGISLVHAHSVASVTYIALENLDEKTTSSGNAESYMQYSNGGLHLGGGGGSSRLV